MAQLPLARVKTIMKTTNGIDNINKDAVILTTRITELFIKGLAQEAVKNIDKGKTLNYNNVVSVVHSRSKYEFLEYMIPKKITVSEYKKMMKKRAQGISDSSSEDDEEDSTTDATSSSFSAGEEHRGI